MGMAKRGNSFLVGATVLLVELRVSGGIGRRGFRCGFAAGCAARLCLAARLAFEGGYAPRSSFAPGVWANRRTRGRAHFSSLVAARHSLAAHPAAKPQREFELGAARLFQSGEAAGIVEQDGGSREPPAALVSAVRIVTIRAVQLHDLVVHAKQQERRDPVADKQTRVLLAHHAQQRRRAH